MMCRLSNPLRHNDLKNGGKSPIVVVGLTIPYLLQAPVRADYTTRWDNLGER
jgi:hypothetical protein